MLLSAATAIRWWAFETGRTGFDGDEAITCLMARDIWLGQNYPIFFYGQSYCGAITSYYTAAFFWARGAADAVTVRLAGAVLMLAVFGFFYAFARWAAGRKAALAALAILAFAPGYFAVWSLKMRGNYALLPALAAAILWPAMALDERIRKGRPGARWLAAALGFAIGLGWWNDRQVVFAIGGVVLWQAWHWARWFGQGNVAWRLARALLMAGLAGAFVVSLGRPLPVSSERFGPAAVALIRLSAIPLLGALLALAGEWNSPGRLRGSWAAGVAACLIGYLPALVFMAGGQETTTQFFPASLKQIADNLCSIVTQMLPGLLGLAFNVEEGGFAAPLLSVLFLVLLVSAVCSAIASARSPSPPSAYEGRRLRDFLWLMALSSAVALSAQVLSGYTPYLLGDPRHLSLLVYALAATCGVGWAPLCEWLKRRAPRLPAGLIAAAILAIHGVSSVIALPPDPLDAAHVPVRYEKLLSYLRSKGVRACYMMDHALGRGYWEAMELTFYTGTHIRFVPPIVGDRLPANAEFARRQQRPAVWVTRFPRDLVENYVRCFERPQDVVVEDVGEYHVVFSGETERMYDLVYRLVRESAP